MAVRGKALYNNYTPILYIYIVIAP